MKSYEKFLRGALRDAHRSMESMNLDVFVPDEMDQAMERVVDRWRWRETLWKENTYNLAYDMYTTADSVIAYLEGIEAEMKGATE